MKKFIMVLLLLFAFQPLANAKLGSKMEKNYLYNYSVYTTAEPTSMPSFSWNIVMVRVHSIPVRTSILGSNLDAGLAISKINPILEPSPKAYLSLKKLPIFEITYEQTTKIITIPEKKASISDGILNFSVNRQIIKDILKAEQIKIVFEAERNEKVVLELPEEIVEEWQKVITGKLRSSNKNSS